MSAFSLATMLKSDSYFIYFLWSSPVPLLPVWQWRWWSQWRASSASWVWSGSKHSTVRHTLSCILLLTSLGFSFVAYSLSPCRCRLSLWKLRKQSDVSAATFPSPQSDRGHTNRTDVRTFKERFKVSQLEQIGSSILNQLKDWIIIQQTF